MPTLALQPATAYFPPTSIAQFTQEAFEKAFNSCLCSKTRIAWLCVCVCVCVLTESQLCMCEC